MHTLDGREIWVNTSGAPVRGPDGQISGVVLISRDVTARRGLEHQLQEQSSGSKPSLRRRPTPLWSTTRIGASCAAIAHRKLIFTVTLTFVG